MLRATLVRTAFALLFLAAGFALRAGAQNVPVLETELALERKLLAGDLAGYSAAREAERAAADRAGELAGRFDELLAEIASANASPGRSSAATPRSLSDRSISDQALSDGILSAQDLPDRDQPPVADPFQLLADLEAAQLASRGAAERVDHLRRAIGERLRRIAAIEEELAPGARRDDPVSGRWRVRLQPQDRSGIFDLRLDGTLVSGSYRLEGGSRGSFRGTWSNGELLLERVDADRGFDSEYRGTVDAAAGRIEGIWQAHDLASGEPASGTWSAERLGPEGEQIEEEDIE